MPTKRIRGNLLVTGTITPALGTEYADDEFTIKNASSATKKVRLSAASVTAGQTRVLTAPDYNGTIATLAGAETLTNKKLNGHVALSRNVDFMAAATVTTAGAATLTAAQLLGGIVLRDPNGDNRSDVLPTAALLVAAIAGCVVGTAFEFTIRNTADAAETITVAAGSGGTVSGTATIAQNNSKRFLIVISNVTASSEAYTAYSLGTVVH